MILALSGVEAVANITGVMNSIPARRPIIRKSRGLRRAIIPVAIEVVVGGPPCSAGDALDAEMFAPEFDRALGRLLRSSGTLWLARGRAVVWQRLRALRGVVFGLLLFSAVNTAVVAPYRGHVYDGAGWRDAETIGPPQSPRCALDSALVAVVIPSSS